MPSFNTLIFDASNPLFAISKNVSWPLTVKLILPSDSNLEVSVLIYSQTGFLLSKSTNISVASFVCPSKSAIFPAGILIFNCLNSSSNSPNLTTKL